MDSKNFAIGILSTTAAILLVGVLIIHSRPSPALASGVTETGGNYVLTVGTYTINDEELLFVIDSSALKMITYRFHTGKGEIQIADAIDLQQMRDATAAAAQPSKPTTKRRGGRRP